MNNQNNGVFGMIHDDEKNAKIDPEKWATIDDPRASPQARATDEGDRVLFSGMPVRRVEPRLSTPGAYRVGDTESHYGGRTLGDDSDDGSEESCLMVVPKAALVDDESRDGVMKDVEAPSTKIPIVKARSFPDALHSSPIKKKSTYKRKFRCCMILFCFLLAGLLGGVLYLLGKDGFSNSISLEATNGDRNRNDNRGNDANGNNNNDRRPNGGGNEGGGNGRDGNN